MSPPAGHALGAPTLTAGSCHEVRDGPRGGALNFFRQVRLGQPVLLPRHPNVQSREQEDVHDHGDHEPTDDHDGEGALGVGADGVGKRGWQQSQRGRIIRPSPAHCSAVFWSTRALETTRSPGAMPFSTS